MKATKTTTLASMLKTLTVALALTIASQAHAQHTQGPTVEGVALPSLSGEEGEITEDQVLEVQRQCNENLVKEYLYNGSGGKIGLVGKMELNKDASFIPTIKGATSIGLVGTIGANKASLPQEVRQIRLDQSAVLYTDSIANTTIANSYLMLKILQNNIEHANLIAQDVPSIIMTIDRKWDLDALGAVVKSKSVVNSLKTLSFDYPMIDFKAKRQDGAAVVIFSYPTAKYVSCLKAGVASLAK